MNYGTRMDFLGGEKRKTNRKVEPELGAENAERSRAGAILSFFSMLQNVSKEIQVDLHPQKLSNFGCSYGDRPSRRAEPYLMKNWILLFLLLPASTVGSLA